MKLYKYSPLILQKLIWIPTRLILKFFGRLEVVGLENLNDLKSNVIFACNHTSELDPILLPASLPFFSRFSPMFYTSRTKDLYGNSGWRSFFYGGNFFKLWGSYPVFIGLKDYEKSMRHHISIVEDGGSMCVFPEGKITIDGNIQPAKGGVSYLAYRTKKTIVPVRFVGAYGITLTQFLTRKRHLKVIFGKPLNIIDERNTSLSLDDFKQYANYVMARVGDLK